MKTFNQRFGVSPAFAISSYGNQFTPDNIIEAMEKIQPWGFTNIQIEIFDNDKVDLWLAGEVTKKVKNVAEELGMNISQLVGHLLIDDCASPSALFSNSGIETMGRLVSIAKGLGCVGSITLPIGEYSDGEHEVNTSDKYTHDVIQKRLVEKLCEFYRPVEAAGFHLAVELLPKNIVGGYKGFNIIQNAVSPNWFGLLFDTGHAWVAAEDIYSIPQKHKGSIFGLHLCDNFGSENLKLSPGKGDINWEKLIQNLVRSQYPGYFDLEIICKPEDVEEEYRCSLNYIKTLLYA